MAVQPTRGAMVLSRSGYNSDRDYFQDLVARGMRTEYCEPALREAFNMHVLMFDAESMAPTTITNLSNKESLPSRAAALDPGLVAKKLDEIQPHLQAWKNGKFPEGQTLTPGGPTGLTTGGPFPGWPCNTNDLHAAPGSPTMARVQPPTQQQQPFEPPALQSEFRQNHNEWPPSNPVVNESRHLASDAALPQPKAAKPTTRVAATAAACGGPPGLGPTVRDAAAIEAEMSRAVDEELRRFAEMQNQYSIAVRTAASRHADMGQSLLKQLELLTQLDRLQASSQQRGEEDKALGDKDGDASVVGVGTGEVGGHRGAGLAPQATSIGGDALCLEQLRAIVSSLENTLSRAGQSTAVASGNRQQPSKGKRRGKKGGEAVNAAGNAG